MCRILLVEDDKNIRTLLREFLVRNGYEILEASNGEEALDLYEMEKEKPDLVIIDYLLPSKNGLQVINELLQQKTQSNFLILSGYPNIVLDDFTNDTIRLKIKPIRLDALLSEIQTMIQT